MVIILEKRRKKMNKNILKNKFYKGCFVLMTFINMVFSNAVICFAKKPDDPTTEAATTSTASADADAIANQVLQPINLIIKIIMGVVATGGVIFLIKGLIGLITCINAHETNGIMHEILTMATGIILMSIGVIVSLFYTV
jgi:hypothetical protein